MVTPLDTILQSDCLACLPPLSASGLRFDLIYVSHQSLWLDLTILLRTVLVVLRPCRSSPSSK